MKEMFSVKNNGYIIANEKDKLYELIDFGTKSCVVLDSRGNPTDKAFHETDFDSTSQCQINIDDPTQFSEPVNGFYVYTTHEYQSDPDGTYGLFGIKRANGEKLTDECFFMVGEFSNGLCPVCLEDEKWGCINEEGVLVIPYQFLDAPNFNQYGVACGDCSLIDMEGHPIPETELNYCDCAFENQRYFEIALWSDEIGDKISECGTAPNLTVDIYDTKERKFVAKGVPDGKLDLCSCKAETDVVLAAIKMISRFDSIEVEETGTIIAKKDEIITVFDYYA